MKKLLILITLALALVACKHEEHTYELVYNIYYTEHPVRVTKRFQGHDATYTLGSDRGTNYLYVNKTGSWFESMGEKLENTSAPIQVLSFREIE